MKIAECLRSRILRAGLPVLTLGLILGTASPATADDESDDLEARLEGPLDAVVCPSAGSNASSVVVLGLTVDTTGARFDTSDRRCESLSAGQNVRVRLVSPFSNATGQLVSKRVDLSGGNGHLRLRGPIQALDPVAGTITIYGQTIDTSLALVTGSDDNGCDAADDNGDDNGDDHGGNGGDDNNGTLALGGDGCQPIDQAALMLGQFVQVKLDSTQLPALVAAEIEVENFTNGFRVTLFDDKGHPETEHVDVQVITSTRMHDGSGRLVTRRIRVETEGSRRVLVKGLATGSARLIVRRLSDGKVRKLDLPVTANRTRTVRVQFR